MKKEISKKESLEMCVKMWKYIANFGGNKENAIKKLKLPTSLNNDCPCCEYALQHTTYESVKNKAYDRDCLLCSIPYNKWTRSRRVVKELGTNDPCCYPDSDFIKWTIAFHDEDAKRQTKYAMKIVRKAQKQLKFLALQEKQTELD